jgi:hypothetical protein
MVGPSSMFVGQELDAWDTKDKQWYLVHIVAIDEKGITIHYKGFLDSFDEHFSWAKCTEHIRLAHTHTEILAPGEIFHDFICAVRKHHSCAEIRM